MAHIRAWQPTEIQGATYGLPSGGTVEITDDEPVAMGDGFTYLRLTYRKDNCEIVFEVRNGTPGATSISLHADERPLRTTDLTAIKLDVIRAEVYAVAGVGAFSPDGDEYELTFNEGRKAVQRATSRRTITPEFLALVAKTHQSAPEGARTEAVMAAFQANERKAFRYIAAARKEGFIK